MSDARNSCTYRKLDRRGNVLETCGLVRQQDSVYCPRHTFLHNELERTRQDKELAARDAKRSETSVREFTRAGMIARGYQYCGNKQCRECPEMIEWWKTPIGRMAPFNPMPDETSHAKSHFATCTRASAFRRVS